MTIYIDQSGKVEYTSQDTVVAFSNGHSASLLVKARDKRKIQNCFRQANKPDIFVYKTFATLIFLLIRSELKSIDRLIIDTEYQGRESIIKKHLLEAIWHSGADFSPKNILFRQIGKKSGAHIKAISTFRKLQVPDMTLSMKDVFRWML